MGPRMFCSTEWSDDLLSAQMLVPISILYLVSAFHMGVLCQAKIIGMISYHLSLLCARGERDTHYVAASSMTAQAARKAAMPLYQSSVCLHEPRISTMLENSIGMILSGLRSRRSQINVHEICRANQEPTRIDPDHVQLHLSSTGDANSCHHIRHADMRLLTAVEGSLNLHYS